MRGGGIEESRSETIRRRLVTIPSRFLGLFVVTVLLVPLLLVALPVDAVRALLTRVPPTATRLVLFLWAYLAAEVVGLLALAALWAASLGGLRGAWLRERTWRLQRAWTGALLGAMKSIFGLRLEASGIDAAGPGPTIVLIRHASLLDTLLPAQLVSRPHGMWLRYVLKRELLADPCLDVAGRRLPNYFVRRGTGEAIEKERVRDLARGLGGDEGVVIFPEGTRFTPARRRREIDRLAAHDPALAERAERLGHLLPPRTGGVLALLEGAPEADVVLIAHHGFDGLRVVSDIWRGGLVGLHVRVRITRVPRAAVPSGERERAAWLYDLWQDADDWLAGLASAGTAARGAR